MMGWGDAPLGAFMSLYTAIPAGSKHAGVKDAMLKALGTDDKALSDQGWTEGAFKVLVDKLEALPPAPGESFYIGGDKTGQRRPE